MSIRTYIGGMFSGKSTRLIHELNKQRRAGKRVLAIRPCIDTRYNPNGSLTTHDGIHATLIDVIKVEKLADISEETIEATDVFGIDEGQFFPDLAVMADALAAKGKIVIVAMLDGTYNRTPFGDSLLIIPFSDKVKKLKSICKICKSPNGSFSKFIGDKKQLENGEILVGGEEVFISTCRNCYFL